MTDEEKAIKDLCVKCGSYDFCVRNNQLHCAETVAYIKGLAEGRKERNCVNCSNHGKQFEVMKLEKESKELLDKLNLQNQRLNELKKENEELKAQNKTILEDNDELNKWNDELREQVEKMKCCRNCLYENNDEELVKEMKNNQCPCTDCKKLNYKNWRLYK